MKIAKFLLESVSPTRFEYYCSSENDIITIITEYPLNRVALTLKYELIGGMGEKPSTLGENFSMLAA
jgi:hypothetical protein